MKRRTCAAPPPRTAPVWEGDDSPYGVSEKWRDAMLLVELSKRCLTSSAASTGGETALPIHMPDASPAPKVGAKSTAEEEAVSYLLRHCRFPVECWWMSLTLLERWRQLHATRLQLASRKKKTGFFPADLSTASCAHLMRNLSCSGAAWVDVIRLYEMATRDIATPKVMHRQQETADREGGGRRLASRGSLRWMRHTALVSLLRAGQWKESLHFYRHMLYQRESPSHVVTGHLVQRLGEVGCWEAVVRIFEIHLKLIDAAGVSAAAGPSKNELESPAKRVLAPPRASTPTSEWGTMFSMSLDVVSRVCERPFIAMQMFNAVCNKNVDGSLFRWDGNFLSAVQSFPLERDRAGMLRRAKLAGQLDHFKLVRGLVHHNKWLEAMTVFAEGLATQQLHRRDIGRCRLSILHASSGDNVQAVLRRLQSLVGRPEASLRVNDAEVECVLSKVPSKQLSSNCVPPASPMAHWCFCLQLLSANYASLATNKGRNEMPVDEGRQPTKHMLSLLLRNSMPWQVVLRICERSRMLDARATQDDAVGACSTSSDALMANRVAHILHRHGQQQRMREFLASALRARPLSPSSELLEFVPLEFFLPNAGTPVRNVLLVEDKVFYHFIETTMDWERALRLLHIVEDQRAAMAAGEVTPLRRIPASVHCGVLKMLRRCCGSHSEQWLLSLRYFQHTVSGVHLPDCNAPPHPPSQQHGSAEENTTLYCVLYETLLNLLDEPAGAYGVRAQLCCSLVERVMTRCGRRIPTHMLLPNQMDRLLPRLSVGDLRVPNVEDRTRVSMKLVRCALTGLKKSAGPEEDQCCHLAPPEAVMFHELQKLVCRVAEYRHHLGQLHEKRCLQSGGASREVAPPTEKRPQLQPFQMGLLWQTSLELLGHQCRACGTDTMKPGTLKLVYRLCATSGGQWEAALRATLHLLQHQRPAEAAVVGEHCSMYLSLFGWDKALEVWCRHFPQETLRAVSGHAKGLEHCMQAMESAEE
ncbi:hypothetical protein TRSC58_05137 [Trypanosoma rangeli SC58]|uniref:Uncharacterized protein n=1 Tax=Trypanosoma rangeli SC58 TaxID=429131 RepID=A0A061IYM7_TRYRA|nr:hypothetical protein TRSC58_05137 [Trypanosoma rangeli SC58]